MTTPPNWVFASHNTAGACQEVMNARALARAHPSSGENPFTVEAACLFRTVFETDCDVYFVFNGIPTGLDLGGLTPHSQAEEIVPGVESHFRCFPTSNSHVASLQARLERGGAICDRKSRRGFA